MRAAEEIQGWNEFGEGTGTHAGDVAQIAAIITRHLPATPAEGSDTWATIKQPCGFCGQQVEHVCTAFLKDAATTSPETPDDDDLPVCLKCKHFENLDPRGHCKSAYRDAGGSLVYCGCKCEFAAPIAGTDDNEGACRVTPEVAAKLIHLRDTLAKMESSELVNEAWHTLYSIADPEIASFTPWSELERLAALRTQGEGK